MGQAIRPREGLERIALYQGGDSTLPGRSEVLKLSSNENPAGPSPAGARAFGEAARELHRYPSTDHAGLREAIAQVHGLDAGRIICGAGSDEIIAFLCYAYGGPDTEVIHTEHGFSMYRISALASGAEPVEVGETERRVDVDKILAGVTDRTRLVFIANPANPTGTMIDLAEIERLADALPSGVILVLDGAYAEFADGYDGGAALAAARENVVMTRTFSKLYGLGGLRIGWGYGPRAIIDDLNRVRGPFNLSNAQLAAGEAAIRDRDWAEKAAEDNARLRDWLTERLRGNRIQVDDSHANFVLARFESEAEALACDQAFREAGILVRRVGGYGFPQALRITVGLQQDCKRVADVIEAFRGGSA